MIRSRQLRAILALPITATIIIPSAIIFLSGEVSLGWGLPNPIGLVPLILGGVSLGLGLLLLIRTIALFEGVGGGTLAPWDPTRRLVVRGVYRYVRNPMISGVALILLGGAALLGSIPVLYWSLLFLIANAVYIPTSEEPGLVRRFGDDYLLYKKNVPRWIPRLRPWIPPFDDEDG